MLDESISVRRLSDEFCISSTSIVKDLEKVEQELLQQDILLLRTKAGTRIEDVYKRQLYSHSTFQAEVHDRISHHNRNS